MSRMCTVIKKIPSKILALMLIFTMFITIMPNSTVKAANNGLGEKPYMGWSSYSMQVYTSQGGGNGGQWINAAQIKAQSDAMYSMLQSHGYNRINIDAGWNDGMDQYGRPIPSSTLYPNGFQEVIDYVHNNGQKIGVYFIPGLNADAYNANLPIYGTPYHIQDIAYKPLTKIDYWDFGYKIDFSKPGAQEYINSIADLLGEWGVDFVKLDSVTPGSGITDLSKDSRDDVKAWYEALNRHKIWLELSWALDINYADYWKQYSNGWRVFWDVEAYAPGKLTTWDNIARLFPLAEQWWRHAAPGGWNDFDSLNVGNGSMDGITEDERRTAMTFWAVSAAQLYTGNDLTKLDNFGLSLLTNDEVIAVDQAGHPAHPVSTATQQQVWYSNNGDGTLNVALFNLGSSPATVGVKWSDMGLSGPAYIRDLWTHTDLGLFNTGYSSVNLPAHASKLFKVTAKGGTVTVNDDDTSIKYSGAWSRQWNRGYGDLKNDVHFTQTNGDYFEYAFYGSGVDLITEKCYDQGDIDIYLDGVFQQTVSTYSATRLAQQVVFSKTGLSNGTHTIKGVKKTGAYMLLDGLRFIAPSPSAPLSVTVNMRKKNAMGYAIDGNNGGANGQQVYLWEFNADNINQDWIEIDRGGGYYSYQKKAQIIVSTGEPAGATGNLCTFGNRMTTTRTSNGGRLTWAEGISGWKNVMLLVFL